MVLRGEATSALAPAHIPREWISYRLGPDWWQGRQHVFVALMQLSLDLSVLRHHPLLACLMTFHNNRMPRKSRSLPQSDRKGRRGGFALYRLRMALDLLVTDFFLCWTNKSDMNETRYEKTFTGFLTSLFWKVNSQWLHILGLKQAGGTLAENVFLSEIM